MPHLCCVCCFCLTSDAMDLCDLPSHHVVDKEVLSLSCQYHLFPILAKVGRGDGKTLNVHTLKFRIHLTINLSKNNIMKSTMFRTEYSVKVVCKPIKISVDHKKKGGGYTSLTGGSPSLTTRI